MQTIANTHDADPSTIRPTQCVSNALQDALSSFEAHELKAKLEESRPAPGLPMERCKNCGSDTEAAGSRLHLMGLIYNYHSIFYTVDG